MDRNHQLALEARIREELLQTEETIASLKERTRPVAPDAAIGRLTRMEAINSKSVNEAALRQAERRETALRSALQRLRDDPDFGLCEDCDAPIAPGRLAVMPETVLCVRCAELREKR